MILSYIKAALQSLLNIKNLLLLFKMLQGAIKSSPGTFIEDMTGVVEDLKELKKGDTKKRAKITMRISNLVNKPRG